MPRQPPATTTRVPKSDFAHGCRRLKSVCYGMNDCHWNHIGSCRPSPFQLLQSTTRSIKWVVSRNLPSSPARLGGTKRVNLRSPNHNHNRSRSRSRSRSHGHLRTQRHHHPLVLPSLRSQHRQRCSQKVVCSSTACFWTPSLPSTALWGLVTVSSPSMVGLVARLHRKCAG